jgi:Protein of unknown function (DUF1097)
VKNYLGIGISIGVLAGVWTALSTNIVMTSMPLITWVGFAAWACYFAAGAGVTGLTKSVASNLSGAVYGWLVLAFIGAAAFKGNLAIAVGVIALLMCLQASISVLSFIPGAFIGAASYFGTTYSFWPTVVAIVVGALFGFASGWLGEKIQAMVAKPTTVDPPAAAHA